MPNGTTASGQIVGLSFDDVPFATYTLNSDSVTPSIISSSPNGGALVVDTALSTYFRLVRYDPSPSDGSSNSYLALDYGSLNGNSGTPTTRSTEFSTWYEQNTALDENVTYPGRSMSIDTANHRIYIPIGSASDADNGFVVTTYTVAANGSVSFTTPTYIEKTPGNQAPSFFDGGGAYDARTGNIYADNVQVQQPNGTGENGIYRISTTGNSTPVSILNASGLANINGLALDRPDNRLYFATVRQSGANSDDISSKFYVLNNASTANASTVPVELTYAAGVTPAQIDFAASLAYDENAHVLYAAVNSDDKDNPPHPDGLYKFQLNSTGSVITGYALVSEDQFTRTQFGQLGPITFSPLSNLTLNGTASSATPGGPATTLLTGLPSLSDYGSGGYLQSAFVSVKQNGMTVSGDVLGIVKNGTFTQFSSMATQFVDNNHTFAVSYTNGVLTIANNPGTAGLNTLDA